MTEPASIGKAIWWLVLLRGILAIAFGVLAILFPVITLVGVTIVFAAYAIIDGVTTLAHAVRSRARNRRWGWLVAQGVVSVLAGLVAAIFPALAGLVGASILLWIIAFWSILAGFAGFPAAHAIADGGRKAWAYVASVLSVVFGIALVAMVVLTPVGAVISLVWVVGAYAILFGVMLVVLAITARTGTGAGAEEVIANAS